MFSWSVLHCGPINSCILSQIQDGVGTFSANAMLYCRRSAAVFTLPSLQIGSFPIFLLTVFNLTYQSNLKLSCSKNIAATWRGRKHLPSFAPRHITVLLSLRIGPHLSLSRFDSFTKPEEITTLLLAGVVFSCINEWNWFIKQGLTSTRASIR